MDETIEKIDDLIRTHVDGLQAAHECIAAGQADPEALANFAAAIERLSAARAILSAERDKSERDDGPPSEWDDGPPSEWDDGPPSFGG